MPQGASIALNRARYFRRRLPLLYRGLDIYPPVLNNTHNAKQDIRLQQIPCLVSQKEFCYEQLKSLITPFLGYNITIYGMTSSVIFENSTINYKCFENSIKADALTRYAFRLDI